ncbi:MAG: B12-binding domain-containing radical SAM protein, partial [Magnetococcales bacterium]|nr:B12-binding domain-containing radical SAM protein [Magnetococcales bacterium]
MNVLGIFSVEQFFSVAKPLRTATEIPFGISAILANLEQAGFVTDLIVLTPISPFHEMLRESIRVFQPRMVCLTAVSTQYQLILGVARILRQINPSLFIIIGGHYASLNSTEVINESCIDAVCIGEGDHAIVELARRIEANRTPSGIPGLWIKHNDGSIEKNPLDRFITNLDSLPWINRRLWSQWIYDSNDMPSVLVGRGCPYQCTYCSNHAMAGLTKGKYVRFRSVDNLISEVDQIVKDSPDVRIIYLEVETIGAFPDYCIELAEKLIIFNGKREKPLQFGANISPTRRLFSDKKRAENILSLFAKAGFVFLNIGLESGSERIRK